MPNKFTCDICNRTLHATRGELGYVVPVDTCKKMCYDCLGKRDIETQLRDGKCIMWLRADEKPNVLKVVNWPGTLEFSPYLHKVSKHNIAKIRIDAWWIGPDGAVWHGHCFGDSLLIRCYRHKKQKKELYPLPEGTYIRKHPYLVNEK